MSFLRTTLSMITGEPAKAEFKVPRKVRPFGRPTERQLIQRESDLGSTLFGPIPDDCRREFFNLDKKTWVWYEQWLDDYGVARSTTTRYEIQGDRVLKAQDGARYSYLEGDELQNFGVAVQMYYEQVMRKVYHKEPYAPAT